MILKLSILPYNKRLLFYYDFQAICSKIEKYVYLRDKLSIFTTLLWRFQTLKAKSSASSIITSFFAFEYRNFSRKFHTFVILRNFHNFYANFNIKMLHKNHSIVQNVNDAENSTANLDAFGFVAMKMGFLFNLYARGKNFAFFH